MALYVQDFTQISHSMQTFTSITALPSMISIASTIGQTNTQSPQPTQEFVSTYILLILRAKIEIVRKSSIENMIFLFFIYQPFEL